jgi:hypothetical protein
MTNSNIEYRIGNEEHPVATGFAYFENTDDLTSYFSASRSIPQTDVKDVLYQAFVQACKDWRSTSSRADMSLPIGKILDLV